MLAEKYAIDGFCLLENAFDADFLFGVRQEILLPFSAMIGKSASDEDLYLMFEESFDDFLSCSKISHQVPSLHALGVSKPLLDFAKDVGIAFPVINTRPVLLFSSPMLARHHFYWKSRPHQDSAIMLGSPDAVVFWMPLCAIEESYGYLEVIPGSHLGQTLSHKRCGPTYEIDSDIADEQFVRVPMRLGDVLAFSSNLIHRSGHNSSGLVRLTVSYRFDNLLNIKYMAEKYPLGFEYVMKGQRD